MVRRATIAVKTPLPWHVSSGYDTDTPDEVQQEAVRRVCGALGMREQFDAVAAGAAGELLDLDDRSSCLLARSLLAEGVSGYLHT